MVTVLHLPAAHVMIQAKLFLLETRSLKMVDHGMHMELAKFQLKTIVVGRVFQSDPEI